MFVLVVLEVLLVVLYCAGGVMSTICVGVGSVMTPEAVDAACIGVGGVIWC